MHKGPTDKNNSGEHTHECESGVGGAGETNGKNGDTCNWITIHKKRTSFLKEFLIGSISFTLLHKFCPKIYILFTKLIKFTSTKWKIKMGRGKWEEKEVMLALPCDFLLYCVQCICWMSQKNVVMEFSFCKFNFTGIRFKRKCKLSWSFQSLNRHPCLPLTQ